MKQPSTTSTRPFESRAWRWLVFGLWLLLVSIVILSADSGRFRAFFTWVNRVPLVDKAGHFLFIGMLAFLLNHALGGRALSLGPLRLLLGGLIIALGMTGEEFSQMWFPDRRFEWGDLAANYVGIACAQLAFRKSQTHPEVHPGKRA